MSWERMEKFRLVLEFMQFGMEVYDRFAERSEPKTQQMVYIMGQNPDPEQAELDSVSNASMP